MRDQEQMPERNDEILVHYAESPQFEESVRKDLFEVLRTMEEDPLFIRFSEALKRQNPEMRDVDLLEEGILDEFPAVFIPTFKGGGREPIVPFEITEGTREDAAMCVLQLKEELGDNAYYIGRSPCRQVVRGFVKVQDPEFRSEHAWALLRHLMCRGYKAQIPNSGSMRMYCLYHDPHAHVAKGPDEVEAFGQRMTAEDLLGGLPQFIQELAIAQKEEECTLSERAELRDMELDNSEEFDIG